MAGVAGRSTPGGEVKNGWLGIVALWLLAQGCYATTSTPPGPNCVQQPDNPACFPPVHDKPKPGDPKR